MGFPLGRASDRPLVSCVQTEVCLIHSLEAKRNLLRRNIGDIFSAHGESPFPLALLFLHPSCFTCAISVSKPRDLVCFITYNDRRIS